MQIFGWQIRLVFYFTFSTTGGILSLEIHLFQIQLNICLTSVTRAKPKEKMAFPA